MVASSLSSLSSRGRAKNAARRLFAATLVAALLAPSFAAAQPKPKTTEAPSPAAPTPLSETLSGMAKAEYEAGKVLFADKDFANAIVKFEKAYELSKDPRLLWNVAVCQKNLRRYAKMLVTLRKLLADGGPLLTEQDRKDADDLAKTVESFVSKLSLVVNEPGAKIVIDGEEVGATPLGEPLLVDVGPRKVRIEKAGFVTIERTVEVAGGGTMALELSMVKEVHEGRLVVVAAEGDIIAIDGKVVGQGRYEGVLPSGGHTLRVSAEGMMTYQSEVVLKDNERRQVPVTLNPVPRDMTETILWIAGGVVLAAGATVGGILLFQPTEKDAVDGSITPGVVQLHFGGRR